MAWRKRNPKHRYSPASTSNHDGPLVAYFHRINGWKRQPGDKLTPWQRITITGALFTVIIVAAWLAYIFGNFIGIALEGDPARNR